MTAPIIELTTNMARWCAAHYFSGDAMASRGLSAAFGFISYAIRAQILSSIPEIWGAALRRFGIRKPEGDKP